MIVIFIDQHYKHKGDALFDIRDETKKETAIVLATSSSLVESVENCMHG